METEYSSYKLDLTHKRASWLVNWLREKVRQGQVTARDLGRLGFAYSVGLGEAVSWPAICLAS